MEQTITPEQEYPTPIDLSTPAMYLNNTLVFSAPDIPAAVTQIESGIRLLVLNTPFLAGSIVPLEQTEPKKPRFGIRSPTDLAKESILPQVRHLPVSIRELYAASPHLTHGVADPSYFAVPGFPEQGKDAPIFRLQINALRDGIVLGLSVHHVVADGTGFGAVVRELGASCRAVGGQGISLPWEIGSKAQGIGRKILNECVVPMQNGHDKDGHTEGNCNSCKEDASPPSSLKAPLLTHKSTLSGVKVQALKLKLTQMIQDIPELRRMYGDTAWVSSNNIVMALTWMCFSIAQFRSKARSLRDDQEREDLPPCTLDIAVNIRDRIRPSLPKGFLGNAYLVLSQHTNTHPLLLGHLHLNDSLHNDFLQHPNTPIDPNSPAWYMKVCHLALGIRQRLNSMDDAYVRNAVSALNSSIESTTSAYPLADLAISSWRDIGVYDVDFGDILGNPVDMQAAEVPLHGLVFILPRQVEGDGAWEVRVTVDEETMRMLHDDIVWAEYTAGSR